MLPATRHRSKRVTRSTTKCGVLDPSRRSRRRTGVANHPAPRNAAGPSHAPAEGAEPRAVRKGTGKRKARKSTAEESDAVSAGMVSVVPRSDLGLGCVVMAPIPAPPCAPGSASTETYLQAETRAMVYGRLADRDSWPDEVRSLRGSSGDVGLQVVRALLGEWGEAIASLRLQIAESGWSDMGLLIQEQQLMSCKRYAEEHMTELISGLGVLEVTPADDEA